MKTSLKFLLGCLLALTPVAKAGDNIFWIDSFSVTSSPGVPLTGSGFGNMSGNFSNVQWEGTNLGSMSGNFSLTIGWNATTLAGIPWSVDPTLDAIVFDTQPGDFILAGNPTLTGVTPPPGYTICALKTLICVDLDSTLESEIRLSTGKGETLYYGFKDKGLGEFFEFSYSGKNYVLDERISTTEGLSFFYSDDGGFTKTEFSKGLDFDTGIKIGGCVCAVPEPSGALLLGATGLALIIRRRRHLR